MKRHLLAVGLCMGLGTGALAQQVADGGTMQVVVTPAPPAAAVVPAPAPHPNAGFGNEVFFLRSDDDNFILIPAGRFQYDFYGYQGGSKEPFNTFQPKRVRLEAFGTFMKHWDFQMGAEFTSTTPIFTDDYVVANYTPLANIQLGQFDAPFTMENRTSDKWTDLQERSRMIAAFAIPENKQIGGMVFGQPEAKWAYWSIGLFNGEGIDQLPHRSNNFDVMGRAWIAPFGVGKAIPALENAYLGGSFWAGNHQSPLNNQPDRLAMKTEAGFTFFNPVYTSPINGDAIHAGDFGPLNKYGLELNVPIWRFVIKGEYVTSDEGIREIDAKTTTAVRTAHLNGNGFYARVSYFVWGDKFINGLAGMQAMPHLFGELRPVNTATALQLVAEYDHISFVYSGDDGAAQTADPLVGNYAIDILGAGVNYWHTKHVRLTANFLYNFFSGQALHPQISGSTSYEITFRAALAF